MKGCWTPSNRNIVFSLLDSYERFQSVRKNLTAEALKPVKVDAPPATPPVSRSVATPPVSRSDALNCSVCLLSSHDESTKRRSVDKSP